MSKSQLKRINIQKGIACKADPTITCPLSSRLAEAENGEEVTKLDSFLQLNYPKYDHTNPISTAKQIIIDQDLKLGLKFYEELEPLRGENERLREALTDLLKDLEERAEMCGDEKVLACGNGVLYKARQAIKI